MNVSIETREMSLAGSDSDRLQEEVSSVLARFARDIRAVELRLARVHGPGGETGMSAHLSVYPKHRAPVRITTVHKDPATAVSISARRAELAVERSLAKRRRWQRALKRRLRYANAVTAPI